MSTIRTIDPFPAQLEFERSSRPARGAAAGPRGGQPPRPTRSSQPPYTPAWRRRRSGGPRYPTIGPAYDEPDPQPALSMADGEPARPGSSEYVRWVQDTLNTALGTTLSVDGVMTNSLRQRIRAFQWRCRLPVSGFIGPDTEAALRRVRRDREQREFEFEWELSGEALRAENALAVANAKPVALVLKALGNQKIPGLYRFHTSTGKFYTGKAVDLRRRLIQHMWCLSHFGKTARGMKLALHLMRDATEAQVRALEKKINEHHKNDNNRLNRVTELEVLALNEI